MREAIAQGVDINEEGIKTGCTGKDVKFYFFFRKFAEDFSIFLFSKALMLACAFKHDDRVVIVKTLLTSGAKINAQASADRKTALHVAAHQGALGKI